MSTLFKKYILATIFIGFSSVSIAEDIDLFTGAAPADPDDKPNVLIILDNTANWNLAFVNEIAALSSTLNGLPDDEFRVGLMMFSETGGGNGNPDGSYVRAAVRLMDANNKPLYQNLVNSLDKIGDKGNAAKLSLAMAESYYYFTGKEAYAGHNKNKRDYTNNILSLPASDAIYALSGNAFDPPNDNVYKSPVNSGCQKNFIIYISNGPAQDNSSDTRSANSQLAALGGNTTEISLIPSGSQSNAGDEWARFMATDSATKITTYTIDVDPVLTGQGPANSALLESMAIQGKGTYFTVDSSVNSGEEIKDALEGILSEIQAENSVFASASLPVSVNTQGTFLNQIFIGMFRPDVNAKPRWDGNLKQYQFVASEVNNEIILNLADADGTLAINNDTGFITPCARSFWTPTIVDSYWFFKPQGVCKTTVNSEQSNTPDGNVVEKGAAGYMLRSIIPSSRVVKTCDPSTCTSLTDFNDANASITQTLLGVNNAAERTELINWSRGMNVKNEGSGGIPAATDMRPSAHGDVVHSRPVAIDYGAATGGVVVFYGASDGLLHAVNGNQSGDISGQPPGSELWTFIAPEHYGRLKRIFDNSPAVTLPSDGTDSKPYFFDGPITAHKDNNTVWIYATQRRGGRMIYAFDASTPTNPSLKWRQGCPNLTDDVDCTTGFSGIGQTWSAAKIVKTSGYVSGSTELPMLMIGGGYDACEDGVGTDDLNTCSTPKGNNVLVLDADSGALLKTLSTDRSVVGDLTVVTNSLTGLAEYAYLVDTGGYIYRIDIGSEIPANWTITKIASLGCDATACSGGVANRKFLFSPEVVVTPGFNMILVGSGDREHPLLSNATTTSVDNAFFMVKDVPTDPLWWDSELALCGTRLACKSSLLAIDANSTVTPTKADLALKEKGWYLAFGSGDHDKEQVVTSAVAVLGVVTFSTHTPTPLNANSCSNLGEARVYNISFLDGSPIGATRGAVITGGGLPPSPVAGIVTVTVNGKQVNLPFVIGSSSDSSLEGKSPRPLSTPANFKTRAYWYLEQ